MINDCLRKGNLSSVKIGPKSDLESFLINYFKDYNYFCEYCEKISNDEESYYCTKSPKCYHKVNNASILEINIIEKTPIQHLLFVYGVTFKNKIKKNEEHVFILLDDEGKYVSDIYTFNDIYIFNDKDICIENCSNKIDLNLFDKYNIRANEILDKILYNKKNIFDLQIKKEVESKIRKISNKFDEEKIQKIYSEKWKFNEEEWDINKNNAIINEKETYNTFISVKFLNLLVINTEKIYFSVKLSNNALIESSFVLGFEKKIKINCPLCGSIMEEGYATEDGHYLCYDCIKQSIETGKIYSYGYDLDTDNTTKEFIEYDEGFICDVCYTHNSKLFEFVCNFDGSSVCYSCFDICSKCNKIYSQKNLIKSNVSNKFYCVDHAEKCEKCYNYVGVDELNTCYSTGKKYCVCTPFSKCELCGEEYSSISLLNGKCIACRSIVEDYDVDIISLLCSYNPKLTRIKKWLIGRNKLNIVVIVKGFFSDTMFIIKDRQTIIEKKIPIFTKLKGY